MFDPSDQLHEHFMQQGMSELEAYREANRISGRCIMHLAQQPDRATVIAPSVTNMETTTENIPDSEIIDLGFDVTKADVARPVLQPCAVKATIAFTRREKSRQKGLDTLVVGYKTDEPTKDLNGKVVNPGFMLMQRIIIEPTGGLTQQMIKDRTQRIHFAAAGEGRVNTGAWIGKQVSVRVTLREPRTDEATGITYDASNDIGGVYPVKT